MVVQSVDIGAGTREKNKTPRGKQKSSIGGFGKRRMEIIMNFVVGGDRGQGGQRLTKKSASLSCNKWRH